MEKISYRKLLKQLLEERGWNQKQLAEKVKSKKGEPITASYISYICTHDRVPPPEVSVSIAKALGINPKRLILRGFYESVSDGVKEYLEDEIYRAFDGDDMYKKGFEDGYKAAVSKIDCFLNEIKNIEKEA